MNKLLCLILVLACLTTLVGCAVDISKIGTEVDGQEYKSITADEYLKIKKLNNAHLVDVRNPEDIETYIEGMINVRLNDIHNTIADVIPNQNDIIVVYCKTGVRSAKAARILCNEGYLYVFNLGGIEDWPYEVISNDEQ